LLVQGSSVLLQTLLAHDLLDEIKLLIFPIVLGRGKRLFGEGTVPAGLRLTGATASTTGVLITSYTRAGAVATGNFGMETPSEAEIARRKTLEA
jgi:dihydrofolate reductase